MVISRYLSGVNPPTGVNIQVFNLRRAELNEALDENQKSLEAEADPLHCNSKPPEHLHTEAGTKGRHNKDANSGR